MSSPSATSATSSLDRTFPKSRRLGRRSEFQKVYQKGVRAAGPLFAVHLLAEAEEGPARIGLTVSRKVGKAVVRNRVKRWLREAVRVRWDLTPPNAWIVFHARNGAAGSSYEQMAAEMDRLLPQVCRRAGIGKER